MSDSINIATPDGSFNAYATWPAAVTQAPAVVVLQEIFGVNADLRQTCEEISAHGFLTLAPDLFWRKSPGVSLTDKTDAEWKRGFALYSSYDVDKGVADIAATMAVARNLPGATGKVGVIGFCLGGLMTYLTASRTGADAAVAYYGGNTEKYLSEAGKVATPLLMHLAEKDEYMSVDAQQSIRTAFDGHPGVEIQTYPGCRHAFARHDGLHYDEIAAAKAFVRTVAFLQSRLS